MSAEERAVDELADRLLASDDKLRAALEAAHLETDQDDREVRRDNFIQIIKSWLAEHG